MLNTLPNDFYERSEEKEGWIGVGWGGFRRGRRANEMTSFRPSDRSIVQPEYLNHFMWTNG